MRNVEPHVIRDAVRAAAALRAARAFEILSADEVFAVAFDGEPDPWFGYAGLREDGAPRFLLARGGAGLRWLRDVAAECEPDPALERSVEAVRFELQPFHTLHPDVRAAYERTGIVVPKGEDAPAFTVLRRGRTSEVPERADLQRATRAAESLHGALTGALVGAPLPPDGAQMSPALDPARYPEDGRLPTLRVRAVGNAPASSPDEPEIHPFTDDRGNGLPPLRLSVHWATEPDEETGVVERDAEARWVAVVADREMQPDEDAPEPPSTAPCLVVLDRRDETPLAEIPLLRTHPRHVAAHLVRGVPHATETEGVLPAEIAFADEAVLAAARGAFEAAGVACVAAPADDPDAVRARTGDARAATPERPEAKDPGVRRWERALAAAEDLLAEAAESARIPDDRSALLYYGSRNAEAAVGDTWWEEAERAHFDWAAVRHRALHGGRTLVEHVLQRRLPADETAVLRALADAVPRIVTIDGIDEAKETVEGIDLLDGGRLRLHWHEFGEKPEIGWTGAVCVHRAGPYTFARLAGPIVYPEDARSALEALAAAGWDGTSAGLATRPQVLGRLWPWVAALGSGEGTFENAARALDASALLLAGSGEAAWRAAPSDVFGSSPDAYAARGRAEGAIVTAIARLLGTLVTK